MTRIERSVVIDRPVEDVWQYVHNPANDPVWQTSLLETRHEGGPPMGVGTRMVEVRRFLGRRFETAWEVSEYEPPRQSAVRSVSGPIPFTGSYVLERVDGRTRFTMRMDTDAHGFFKLAEPVFGRMAAREMEANLGQLKDVLEAGQV